MKKVVSTFLPNYSYIPLLLVLIMNFVTYNVSKIITNSFFHYNISTSFDYRIPFLSCFIVIYVLAYVQWIIGFIVISRESKEYCYQYLSAELIAKFLCLIFFFVFPTTLVRPEITGNNVFDILTKFIYALDAPVNLFPSIHCLESWFCFRGSLKLKKVPRWYKYVMFIFSVLVFLSTVFVKQHVVFDIVGGILVVEVGIFLSQRFIFSCLFEKLNQKLKKIIK